MNTGPDSATTATRAHTPPTQGLQRLERWLILWMVSVALGFPLVRTTGWYAFDVAQDATFGSGSLLLQALFGSIFAAAGLLVWRHGTWLWPVVRRLNPFLLVLLVWAATTVFWSPEPVTTLKRSSQFLGLILLGLTLTLPGMAARDFEVVLFRTLTVIVLASAMVALLLPSIGVDPIRDNAWRGLTWHKNTLGAAAAFCVLLWVAALAGRRLEPRLGFFGLFLVFVVLLLAKSSTALVTGGMAIVAYLVLRRRLLAGTPLAAIAGLALAFAVATLLMGFFAVMGRLPTWAEVMTPIATLFNRDPDLTGRTELWALVLLEAFRHPIQGLGYGAFWLNVGSASQYIIDLLGWVPLQAHNAYIDIFNELGAIGLGLFIGVLLWHVFTLHRLGRIDPDLAALHWAFFLLIFVSNFSESQFLNGLSFQNNLFIFSSILVSGTVARQRREAELAKGTTSTWQHASA